MSEFERGLAEALAIAEAEERKWKREAEGHARNYWGGMNSDHAQSDLKRAKIARRIVNKIQNRITQAAKQHA